MGSGRVAGYLRTPGGLRLKEKLNIGSAPRNRVPRETRDRALTKFAARNQSDAPLISRRILVVPTEVRN